MKRVLLGFLLVVGFVFAGSSSSLVLADTLPTSTDPASTVPTTTTTNTVAVTPASIPVISKPKAAPIARTTIRHGVTISGVSVSGLDMAAATAAVQAAFATSLQFTVDGKQFSLSPVNMATPYIEGAVRKAKSAPVGANIPLVVSVKGSDLRAFVARLAAKVNGKAIPARLLLQSQRPVLTPDVPGRLLKQGPVVTSLVHALTSGARRTLTFSTVPVKAGGAFTTSAAGTMVVVSRVKNRLYLFDNGKTVKTFPVATGQSIYPTPTGTFHVIVKSKNPWWYPPTRNEWAKGLKPVPPGPNNPLGTRWMGLSVPGIGIHGTDEPSSIGYSASHGCIRMQVPDAEWLFDHLNVDTTVVIL
ncbi:MAG: L,D-transpeptidase family protein [Actinobacteria bacterium]|uniref:Unannotated protein n=1 Tax=freshwater metagenome TaxID=449393 RepID=A0A6J6PYI7_9ZZZZ|nr:L,D-transpeptidase family protein [Actinomycetota bacterium]